MKHPKHRTYLSLAASWAAAAALTCCVAFGQETSPNTTPAKKSASAPNDPLQLPDSPAPGSALPPARAPAVARPISSSSSSSSDSEPPRFWSGTDSNAQVTVLEDTLIRVRSNTPLSSSMTRAGSPVLFTLSEDVVVDHVLIVPRGAVIHGTVIESKKAGVLAGAPDLVLKLVSLDFGGRSYPLYTYQFKVEGTSKTKPTETKIKGGAVIGALVGGAFSGSAKGGTTAVGKLAGMGTGAALGAGVGTMVSAAAPGPHVTLPAESQMDFYLSSPISVVPVSAREAARLAQRVRPGGPALYVRGDTP